MTWDQYVNAYGADGLAREVERRMMAGFKVLGYWKSGIGGALADVLGTTSFSSENERWMSAEMQRLGWRNDRGITGKDGGEHAGWVPSEERVAWLREAAEWRARDRNTAKPIVTERRVCEQCGAETTGDMAEPNMLRHRQLEHGVDLFPRLTRGSARVAEAALRVVAQAPERWWTPEEVEPQMPWQHRSSVTSALDYLARCQMVTRWKKPSLRYRLIPEAWEEYQNPNPDQGELWG